MFVRSAKCLLVVALSLTLGLHWAFLQTVAWVGMAITYAQDAPLTVALAKTFDGKHPCKICTFVTVGKSSQRSADVQKQEIKFELFLVTAPRLLYPPALAETRPQLRIFPASFLPPPSVPPPRAA